MVPAKPPPCRPRKFQALIAGETTAQAMYDEIVKQATAVFGEDGCDLT